MGVFAFMQLIDNILLQPNIFSKSVKAHPLEIFIVVMMGATHLLGPRRRTTDKLINFESGIPSVGNARQPMGIKYFLVAILFVLFDVEVIFFYPWATNFKEFGMDGLLSMALFVALFLLGFLYLRKKQAFKWE
jgi:NADH-quinone oxidoreductase subunit A